MKFVQLLKGLKNFYLTTILLVGFIALTGLKNPTQAQLSLFDSALSKTQTEKFEEALDDLNRAADFFDQHHGYENAYKSRAVITYLTEEIERQKALSNGELRELPEWYKLGRCIGGNFSCEHSVSWANPGTTETSLGGVLILKKLLREVQNPDGSSYPINALMDAQVVPKLQAGEWLSSECNLPGQKDVVILAVFQRTGFENADLYTQIRRAWRVNIDTQKIETISPRNIACINPCPGDCEGNIPVRQNSQTKTSGR